MELGIFRPADMEARPRWAHISFRIHWEEAGSLAHNYEIHMAASRSKLGWYHRI